jgi:hypothetical protein
MDGPGAIHRLIMAGGYQVVAKVETDDMEEAFELTNNIHSNWTDNEGVKAYGSDGHRSTSCGDLMLVGEEFYYVAMVGFTKVGRKVPVGQIPMAY